MHVKLAPRTWTECILAKKKPKELVECDGDWCRSHHPCPLPTTGTYLAIKLSPESSVLFAKTVTGPVLTHMEMVLAFSVTMACLLCDPNDQFTGDRAELTRSEKRGLTAFFLIIPSFYLSFFYSSVFILSSPPISSVRSPELVAPCCSCLFYLFGRLGCLTKV